MIWFSRAPRVLFILEFVIRNIHFAKGVSNSDGAYSMEPEKCSITTPHSLPKRVVRDLSAIHYDHLAWFSGSSQSCLHHTYEYNHFVSIKR